MPDLSPVWLSLIVAGTATLVAVPAGLLFAYWLARPERHAGQAGRAGREAVRILLTLPLVLPPTAVGYGLLLLLGRGTAIGAFVNDRLNIHLLFTWPAASIAAAVMALPLIFRTAEAAFRVVDVELLEVGRTLGATEGRLLLSVVAPLSYRGVLAGVALGFARALGEFGATMMVGGSIPGRTETMPIALYNAAASDRDADARLYALVLVGVAVVVLAGIGAWGGRVAAGRGER